MVVINDERGTGATGICENCGAEKPVRPVEEFSWFSGSSRGYRSICFDCLKPRLFWRKSLSGRVFVTPTGC